MNGTSSRARAWEQRCARRCSADPHPRGPLGTVRCPLRGGSQRDPCRGRGHAKGWGDPWCPVRWLYARSLQTGKLRLRQGPGILVLQPSQVQQLSLPTGNCTTARSRAWGRGGSRRRDAGRLQQLICGPGWKILVGGRGWGDQRDRKRKLLCPCVWLEGAAHAAGVPPAPLTADVGVAGREGQTTQLEQ